MAKPKKGVNPFAKPAEAVAAKLKAEVGKNPIGVKKDAVQKALASGNKAEIAKHLDKVKSKNAAFERHKKGK
jgi:hypothetical protein